MGRILRWPPKFPPRGTQVLILSLPFECREVCDCDGFHACDLGEGDLMTKVKGLCRYNYGPNLADFELIKGEVILGGSDLTRVQKGASALPEDRGVGM